MTLETRVETLRQTAIFRDSSNEILRELARASIQKSMTRGEFLFLNGEPVEHAIVVITGTARTYRTRENRELTLGLYGTRQVLGIVAAFLEPPLHTANAEMLEAGSILELSVTDLRRIAIQSTALSNSLLHLIASRFARLAARTDELVLADLNIRFAKWLLEHANKSGFPLPSNSEIAAQLGTVPELVSRKLGEFYKRGWIRLQKRTVWIVDISSLEQQLD